ncbi:MAG: ABC transporter permease [Oscillospiraceae bacterium]|jgi:ABC-type transport system involved in multi-copper enzyme maturation permease subunit|nr:ABC transporter permease [Oscillospiraceae bacterium]
MMRNPVFDSSMRRRMRSYRAPLLLTLYGLFMLVVSFAALQVLQKPELTVANLRTGTDTYIYLAVMQFMLIVLVAPALTAGSIAGERERQTLDLLLCTRVGALKIVLGKLFSSACFLFLLIFSALPVMMVTQFFAGVGFWNLLQMVLFLMVTALACCSIGICCSALFKRTVTATVISYLALFALGACTLLIPLVLQINRVGSWLDAMLNSGYYSSSNFAIIGASDPMGGLPYGMLLNPVVGLITLLVNHTGILQRTLSSGLSGIGSEMHSVFLASDMLAWINMGVLLFASAVLILLAALCVKPSGRKARKKK